MKRIWIVLLILSLIISACSLTNPFGATQTPSQDPGVQAYMDTYHIEEQAAAPVVTVNHYDVSFTDGTSTTCKKIEWSDDHVLSCKNSITHKYKGDSVKSIEPRFSE